MIHARPTQHHNVYSQIIYFITAQLREREKNLL